MPLLQPADLRTVQLVPLTAFDADDRLALDPMRRLNQRLFDAGVRCLIPCAGSAEFHVLADDDITAAVGLAREVVGDAAVVITPIGGAVDRALRLADRTHAAGADAALIMPLAFPYLSDEGAGDYYRRLLDELPCPALIYKKDAVPSDALLLALAEHPRLIGVKYAVNDIDAFQRVVRDDGGRIEWFCGSAERFAPYFFLAGATGYTSGAGNVCPRLTLALHAALAAGNWNEAMRLQRLILPIEAYRARAGSSFNISFLKHAVTATGLDFGPPRPPYRQLTPEERREIESVVGPILAEEMRLAEAAAASVRETSTLQKKDMNRSQQS